MARSAVTGALSYTGRYLTRLLLDSGQSVVNLSRRAAPIGGHVGPQTLAEAGRIDTKPLNFSRPEELIQILEGCDVLYCTYWIRFGIDGDTHHKAANRVGSLFQAAKQAGVRKIVFSSHTHASVDSPFEYIAGKAHAVAALRRCGVDYAVVRPCGIFGDTPSESILMNNAAWVIRRTPLFLLPGDGQHRFQPVHVRDMAALMLALGTSTLSGEERDACGPDAPTAVELFRAVAEAVGARCAIVAPGFLSTRTVTTLSKPIDWVTKDILLDEDDLDLLCSGLTVANDPADPAIAQRRSLFAWLSEVGPSLGRVYVSSVQRYYQKRDE